MGVTQDIETDPTLVSYRSLNSRLTASDAEGVDSPDQISSARGVGRMSQSQPFMHRISFNANWSLGMQSRLLPRSIQTNRNENDLVLHLRQVSLLPDLIFSMQ